MTRVIVLGADGFLGSHALLAVEEAGATAIPAPSRRDLDLATAGDAEIVGMLQLARADVVVNATGQVGGSAEELELGNAGVVQRLIEACAQLTHGVRFIQLGSLAEYGPGVGDPFLEEGPAEPVTPYGLAKLHATRAVLEASARGDVDGTVLRVANPVGARQPAASLIGAVLAQLRSGPGGDVELGSLDGRRDLVSARDVGRAVAAAAFCSSSDPRRRLVNVGSGRLTAVRGAVETVLRLTGFSGRLLEGVSAGSARSAVVRDAVPDVARAEQVLGWTAQDDVETALLAAIEGSGLNVVRS